MIKINKYFITGIIFILIIFYFGINIILNNFNEIKEIVLADLPIKERISQIDDTFRKLPNEKELLNVYSLEQNLEGSNFFSDAEYGFIIKDYEGKLHFPYSKVNVKSQVEKVIELKEELAENNIPLVYVQAPSKKLEGYTNMPVGDYDDWSNECADEFILGIKDKVNVLDLRKKIIEEDVNRDSLFYKTDHHWTTSAAFWGTGKLVEYLNENYNFNIESKYFDKNNYNSVIYKNNFLGSIGRRVGEYIVGLDDYELIYPKFKTSFSIYQPITSKEHPLWEGDFYKTIIREAVLTNPDVNTNRYASYFEYDYGNLIIKNNNEKNGLKLMLVKDSFSLPVIAFLSTGVEELHVVDVRYEGAPKNIVEYAKANDVDSVVILYNTQVFSDTMFRFK